MIKIEDILQEETFVKKVLACETQEEVKAAFKEKDYDISDTELKDLKKFFTEATQKTKEIPPNELEQIVGGKYGDLTGGEKALLVGGEAFNLGTTVLGSYAGYKWAKSAEAEGKDIGKWGYTWRIAVSTIVSFQAGTVANSWIVGEETIKKISND